ncbi:MAG: hypothetical protein D6820_07805, partial [Lentisphaerae bacterium]
MQRHLSPPNKTSSFPPPANGFLCALCLLLIKLVIAGTARAEGQYLVTLKNGEQLTCRILRFESTGYHVILKNKRLPRYISLHSIRNMRWLGKSLEEEIEHQVQQELNKPNLFNIALNLLKQEDEEENLNLNSTPLANNASIQPILKTLKKVSRRKLIQLLEK